MSNHIRSNAVFIDGNPGQPDAVSQKDEIQDHPSVILALQKGQIVKTAAAARLRDQNDGGRWLSCQFTTGGMVGQPDHDL